MTSPTHRRRYGAAVALVLCLQWLAIGRAQEVTEPSLKAAFIYNFAKFTEWPADVLPPTATFAACVLGDNATRDAFGRIVKDHLLAGRPISVSEAQPGVKLRSCHLLYVSGVTPSQLVDIMAMVRGAHVLTISDLDDFVQGGGIAQLFVESGRIRFDINLDIAKGVGLQLSSKLLALAAHVRGPRAQGRESPPS